jgi:lipid-binding SYLF domain-containing protein
MKKAGFFLFIIFNVLFFGTFAYARDLQKDIENAAEIIRDFSRIPEESIPMEVFRDCKGLAILTVGKVGFVLSARGGAGLVIARTPTGWSAPSAIGTGGAGVGFQIGVQVTDFIIVLNTPGAVEAFSRGENVTLGGNLSVAAGPVGRAAEAGITPTAAIYTYSRSKGLFAGASLEGTILVERERANEDYYGRRVDPEELLNGKVAPPESASILLETLKKYDVQLES